MSLNKDVSLSILALRCGVFLPLNSYRETPRHASAGRRVRVGACVRCTQAPAGNPQQRPLGVPVSLAVNRGLWLLSWQGHGGLLGGPTACGFLSS